MVTWRAREATPAHPARMRSRSPSATRGSGTAPAGVGVARSSVTVLSAAGPPTSSAAGVRLAAVVGLLAAGLELPLDGALRHGGRGYSAWAAAHPSNSSAGRVLTMRSAGMPANAALSHPYGCH